MKKTTRTNAILSGKLLHAGLALILFIAASTAMAYLPGDFDPTFGINGSTVLDILGPFDRAYAVAIQPDGKYVVAGDSYNATGNFVWVIVRYNTNGTPDSSFGTNGVATPGVAGRARGIGIQSDGKIVVTGTFSGVGSGAIRLLADGSHDMTFGTAGFANGPIGSSQAMAIDSLDRIIAVGEITGPSGQSSNFLVVRFTPDGHPDPAFGTAGVLQTDFSQAPDFATDVLVQPDNKVVVVGGSFLIQAPGTCEFAVTRYLENGTLDPDFGSGGKAALTVGPFSDFVHSVALQDDQKLVLAGHISREDGAYFAAYRLNTNGAPDTSFGTNGLTTLNARFWAKRGLGFQTDGKIVSIQDEAVIRLSPDGSADSTFGTNGIYRNASERFENGLLTPDGKLIAVGYVTQNGNDDLFIGRYFAEFVAPTPVTVSGRVTTPGGLGLRNAVVSLVDPAGVRRIATTSSFGVYSFQNVVPNETYVITVSSKRYRFSPRTQVIANNVTDADFVGLE